MTMHWPQAGQITLSATNNQTITDHSNSSDLKMQYLRAEIDSLDTKLTQLLLARFELAKEIGREKELAGLPIKDEAREKQLIDRISAMIGDKRSEHILAIFREIMNQSAVFQVLLSEKKSKKSSQQEHLSTSLH